MKRIIALAAFTVSAVLAGSVVAQEAPDHMLMVQAPADPLAQGSTVAIIAQNGVPGTGNVLVQRRGTAMSGPVTVTVSGTEFLMESRPVKGAPFSADAVTETVQTLADGNRITNSSTTKLYRDSEGRTRRELSQGAQAMTVMPFPGPTMSHSEVTISDPVAGVNYMLNTKSRTAMKLPVPQHVQKIKKGPEHTDSGSTASSDPSAKTGAPEHRTGFMVMPSGDNMVFTTHMSGKVTGDFKTESLGKQTIEGVEAQGERVTQTIPAGQIGNEQPIVSTTETWFSPRLQRLVLSKRHDPRFGDTTFKLTNISLTEPSPSLFQVPSDYTITDPKAEAERMRKEGERMRKEFERMKPEFDKMRKDFEKHKPEFDRLRSQSEQLRHELMKTIPNHAR